MPGTAGVLKTLKNGINEHKQLCRKQSFFFCLDKINYSRLIRKGDYFTQKERNVTGTIFSQDTFVFALDL